MKKALSILSGIITLMFVSCTPKDNPGQDNQDNPENPEVPGIISIQLNTKNLDLYVDEAYSLIVTVEAEEGADVTVNWSCSDLGVADVDQLGTVYTRRAGGATITAECGGKTASCNLAVASRNVPVSEIKLNANNLRLMIGEYAPLEATVLPENASQKTVTWNTQTINKNVATVSWDGKVTAVGVGTTKAICACGGKTAECNITVADGLALSSIVVSPATLTLSKGSTRTLTATLLPSYANAPTVIWSVSNKTVLSIENDGTITALRSGKATVTAQCGSKSSKCEVTVPFAAPEAVDMGLSVKWASWNLGAEKESEAGNYYAFGETETRATYGKEEQTYKWWDSSAQKYSRYSDVDNKFSLKDYNYEDDAARVNLGNGWRIPTPEEIRELALNCTSQFTKRDGVDGMLLTSTKTGNSIFLPAAGKMWRKDDIYATESFYHYYPASEIYDDPDYKEKTWSGLELSYSFTHGDLLFANGGRYVSLSNKSGQKRYYGLPIRPVKE